MARTTGALSGRTFQLVTEHPWRIRALKVLAATHGQTMTEFLEDRIDQACREENIFTADVEAADAAKQAGQDGTP